MFVSHIAERADAHLYFTKFRKSLGALPPPGKKSSYATGPTRQVSNRNEFFRSQILFYKVKAIYLGQDQGYFFLLFHN